jgi:hypothetical protein
MFDPNALALDNDVITTLDMVKKVRIFESY